MVARDLKTGEWCHDTGGCSAQYYSPTAGFLTPTAILTGSSSFEKARAVVTDNPKLLQRVDRAKLPALFVLLLRWDEIRAAAGPTGSATAWPPGSAFYFSSKTAAFQEYGRVANKSAVDLRCHYVDGGSRPGHYFNELARCSPGDTAFANPRTLGPLHQQTPVKRRGAGDGDDSAREERQKMPFFSWFSLQVFGSDQNAWCQTLPGFPQNCNETVNAVARAGVVSSSWWGSAKGGLT